MRPSGRLRGAILCGGASRRMGRTKALIDVDGLPMAAHVARALSGAGCDEVVLIGGDAAELAPLGLPVVPDRHPGEGPLGGVLTALERVDPADRIAVVACDLPRLGVDDVVRLVETLARNVEHADVVFARSDRRESMCAVWQGAAAERLRAAFDSGERAVHRGATAVRVVEVRLRPEAVQNVNSPEDLERIVER